MKKEIFILLLLGLWDLAISQVIISYIPSTAISFEQYQAEKNSIENANSEYIDFWKGFSDVTGISLVYSAIDNPEFVFRQVLNFNAYEEINKLVDINYQINSALATYEYFKNSSKAYLGGVLVAMAISHRVIEWDIVRAKSIKLSFVEIETENAIVKIRLSETFYEESLFYHGYTEYALHTGKTIFLYEGEDYLSMVLLGSDWKKLVYSTKHEKFYIHGFNESTRRKYNIILEDVIKEGELNGKPIYTANGYEMYPLGQNKHLKNIAQ